MSPDLIRRRPLPLIGRAKEATALWSELCRVIDSGRMSMLRIEGSSGAGSSHLAQWLCEAAHKTGMAHPIWSQESIISGGPARLIEALRRHLRLDSTPPAEQEGILRLQLTHLGATGLGDVQQLQRLLSDPHSSLRRLSAEESELLLRLCQSLTLGPGPSRPLILVIEDAQWAHASSELLSKSEISWSLSPTARLRCVVLASSSFSIISSSH